MRTDLFEADYYRMTGYSYSKSIKTVGNILLRHNLKFMYVWRKYQKTQSKLYRILLYILTKKYGLEISTKALIREGVYLGHPYNITVAEGVSIGKNVNLHKGCTIGRENRGKRVGVPQIGNCVSIGINSTIVGNITIGDDVMIAPNTFVNFDVPSHSVVIGNPATIHCKEYATEGYVNYLV